MVISVTVFCSCLLTITVGYPIFGEFIPNGHKVPDPCHKGQVWRPVGHQGFIKRSPLNAFGVDFARSRSWDKHLCELDSDGDGRTNGEELGDPNCTWTSSSSSFPPSNTTTTFSLSHPGICEPIDSSRCFSRNLWLNGCRPFVCTALNATDVRSSRLRLPQEVTLPPAGMDTTGMSAYPWRTPGRRTICAKMVLPSAEKDYHVIGSQPVLNPSLLRHVEDIALYACEEDKARLIGDGQFDCDVHPRDLGMKFGCYSLIAAWSWNGPAGECHPTLYGFRIGRRTYRSAILRVQMRSYRASETKVNGAGLAIFFTDHLRPNDAGTLVIEAASPIAVAAAAAAAAGPRASSRRGKCLRPEEDGNCTGSSYPTTINIAQAVIVTDNFDGAMITVTVEKKSGASQKLLEWRDFWDPNSYSSVHLPEFDSGDELVLDCETHSSALFCLARITYYPAISRLGHCDGTPPIDVIPSDTCPLPAAVGPVCRIGFLLHYSTTTFTQCPSKAEACLNLCEMVVDTVRKSGCGSSDLEVQSRSFSQLLRYLDFLQLCPSSTGIPRTFPNRRTFPNHERTTTTTTTLPAALQRIPGGISSADSLHSNERDVYYKRSREAYGMVIGHKSSSCEQNATDAIKYLNRTLTSEDQSVLNLDEFVSNIIHACRETNSLQQICGCSAYSMECKIWSVICSTFDRLLSVNKSSSSKSATTSEKLATTSEKSTATSLKSATTSEKSPLTLETFTATSKKLTATSRKSTASSETYYSQSVDKSYKSYWSSTTVDRIKLSTKRGRMEQSRASTKSVSTDKTVKPPSAWSSHVDDVDTNTTTVWSGHVGLDEISSDAIARANVARSMSAAATKVTAANTFAAGALLLVGLLFARIILLDDDFHCCWDRMIWSV